MQITDLEKNIKEKIFSKITLFIEKNLTNQETQTDFFKQLEKEINQISNFQFYIVVMELPKNNKFNMLYLSKSFNEITGIKSYEYKNFDLFHNYIPKNSESDYLEAIKEIKETDEIIIKNLNFNNPIKGKLNLLTFNKLYKDKNKSIFVDIIFDITKLKVEKIEADKKENKEQKKQYNKRNFNGFILQNAPFTVLITNVVGQIIYTNHYFKILTGYTKEETLGKNPRFLQSGLTPSKIYKSLWTNILNGKTWEGFFVNKKKDGSLYYEKAAIFPQKDKTGKINKIIAFKIDVTKETKLQQKIISTKNLQNSILKLSNLGFCQIKNDKIVSINKKLLYLLAIKKESLISKNISDLPIEIRNFFQLAYQKTKERKNFRYEIFCQNSNKHLAIISYKTNNNILLIFNDITKIKKTEESLIYRNYVLNELFEFIKVALVSIDEKGNIISTNKFFNNLIDKPIEELINNDVTKFFPEKIVTDIILQKEIYNIQTTLINSKNKKYNVVISTKHIYDNLRDNKLIIYCQIEDITKEVQEKDFLEKIVKQKTKELEKSLKKEKELNVLKTDFISKTSHEFRTPLATISVASEFIKKFREKLSQEKLNTKINKIIEQTKYMEHLLDDILLVGKFDSKKVPFSPKTTDISVFLQEIITEFKTLNDNFTFNYSNHTENSIVELDERLGRSIFQNLLSNAIKYSTENKTVNIELMCDDNNLIIEIQDFGLGIPNKYKDKLFTSFVRADNVAAVEGTGLGLTIVKKAVEMHKGKIMFSSEENAGTTFWVHLPLKN